MALEKKLKPFETANPNECAYFTYIQKHTLSLKQTIEYFDRGNNCCLCDGRDTTCNKYISNGTLRQMYQESLYLEARKNRKCC